MRYNNYHVHTHYSNVITQDSILKPKDLAKRAKDLGHTILSTCEHGYAGNFLEKYNLAKENGLKFIYGMEIYYVNNRFEKDNLNSHLCVFAKNKQGFYEINSKMSEANKTGYYYKARWDKELLLSLNPENVVITTACVGSYLGKSKDPYMVDQYLLPLLNHFGNNMYLEIQDNNDEVQKWYNSAMVDFHEEYGIELIHGCDTHYLYPEDNAKRTLYLKGRNMHYPEEQTFILDYPDAPTIFDRYEKQGIVRAGYVFDALSNTLVFDKFEDIDFDKEIKMPSIYRNEDSNDVLKRILAEKWTEEKQFIPETEHERYKSAILDEYNIVAKTSMADYFLLNEKTIKRGKEKGGVLTRTGRGSAPSFYINKLLGFTEIDRLDSEIPLYPTRFMSISRILETRSLPDIDFNCADVTPFVEACKEILGKDNVYLMVAYGTMKAKGAFRNYCRAIGLDVKDYNDVDVETMKDDPYWGKIIEESEMFLDVVDNIKPSPCSYLLLDKPISQEFGLMKLKDEICCCLDGYYSDVFKYLKNDFLTVTVWEIIADVFKEINQPIPNIRELKNELIDKKVWKLYEKGLTATLNQTDSNFSTGIVSRYKPKSVAELSAFVASIRPGFASMLEIFLSRKKFSYGIPEFDELLKASSNFCLYQEDVMKTLIFAGFAEDECYSQIKLIAKKRAGIEKIKDRFIQGFVAKTGSLEDAEKVWKIIEDNAGYSFNSSHSLSVALDSLYGAYLKANYPLEYYTVVLNKYVDYIDRTQHIISELPYFHIQILPIKFRKSRADYSYSKEDNSIYKGIASIKYMNAHVAEELYALRFKRYADFIELLEDIRNNTTITSRQIEILIGLNFFKEFGLSQTLYDIFQKFESRYSKNHTEKTKIQRIAEIREFAKGLENKAMSLIKQLETQKEYLGYIETRSETLSPEYHFVLELDTKYTPRINTYCLKDGSEHVYKISKKVFERNPLDKHAVIRIIGIEARDRRVKNGNEWVETGEKENFLTRYNMIISAN